jgi:hypothetical protein
MLHFIAVTFLVSVSDQAINQGSPLLSRHILRFAQSPPGCQDSSYLFLGMFLSKELEFCTPHLLYIGLGEFAHAVECSLEFRMEAFPLRVV